MHVRLLRQKDESMNKQYVEQRENVYWVTGTRVSLDSIVYAFLEGQTAESIAQSFPIAAVADDLLLIWYATEAEEWINPMRSLPL